MGHALFELHERSDSQLMLYFCQFLLLLL